MAPNDGNNNVGVAPVRSNRVQISDSTKSAIREGIINGTLNTAPPKRKSSFSVKHVLSVTYNNINYNTCNMNNCYQVWKGDASTTNLKGYVDDILVNNGYYHSNGDYSYFHKKEDEKEKDNALQNGGAGESAIQPEQQAEQQAEKQPEQQVQQQ